MDGGSVNHQGPLMLMKTQTVTSDSRRVFNSSRIRSGKVCRQRWLKLVLLSGKRQSLALLTMESFLSPRERL